MMKNKGWAISMIKRYAVLIVGLVIMAFGVGFSIIGNLGTSPISSLPYVSSLITPLTVGQATIVLHCVLIILQILILRMKYEWAKLIKLQRALLFGVLMQLPVALFFGVLTDVATVVLGSLSAANYLVQWVYCFLGIIMVAIGVSCEVTAGVVTLAGEGFVLALCKVTPVKFGTMKVCFDVTLVVIAAILSLIFLHSLQGVREGTAAAALLVGTISRQLNKPLGKVCAKFFK